MKTYYCDHFVLPLPQGHRFPMAKYSRLRSRVAAELHGACLEVPAGATDTELARAHTPEYIERVKAGNLTLAEIRRVGFPWSVGLVERSRRSVGGTIAACRSALDDGIGANLAGGTHHAGVAHGEGFCVFNDVVVAARAMQAEERAARVLIVDADVHQGNGTAAICHDDPTIFSFSIHGERNFPFRKWPSDLDVGLPDGTGDAAYLEALELGLLQALSLAQADMVIYIAGADPYANDRLGRLALSKNGLAARDRLVLAHCSGLPVAIVMGGGYARNIDDIVDIHFRTLVLAVDR